MMPHAIGSRVHHNVLPGYVGEVVSAFSYTDDKDVWITVRLDSGVIYTGYAENFSPGLHTQSETVIH